MPFVPDVWLTMIQTFYPAPTIANLRRAAAERPEYFGGGVLFGSCGEKLRLPTARIWDLMFDCGGPRARWQAIDVTDAAPGEPDPFPLETGPLDELTLPEVVPPVLDDRFTQLVAAALHEMGGSDDQLQLAAETVVASGTAAGEGDAMSGALDDAVRAQQDQQHELDAIRPEDGIHAAEDGKNVTDARPGIPEDGDGDAPSQDDPIDPGPAPFEPEHPPEA